MSNARALLSSSLQKTAPHIECAAVDDGPSGVLEDGSSGDRSTAREQLPQSVVAAAARMPVNHIGTFSSVRSGVYVFYYWCVGRRNQGRMFHQMIACLRD